MDIKAVFKNNQDWVSKKLNINEDYFENLAKGQSPGFLYIGCSDSRVTAEDMMGAQPGDVFVHRNIANVVSNLDISCKAVINYAVEHLKVKHIVVCGHYQCGGVKAAMGHIDLGIINPWLQNIRDVFRIHQKELEIVTDEDKRYNRLVELNVQEQCLNVLNNPDVQRAVERRELEIHGWVFDIKSGKILDLGLDLDELHKKMKSVYHLD